jgi:hypothetical protein
MRLAIYVDGWNFYWSLVEARLKPYGWCDFPLLARQQVRQAHAEVSVKYFTSEDKPYPDKIYARQRPIWWRALNFSGCQIIEGEFRPTTEETEEQNRATSRRWREKKTDVALAAHMVADANRITVDETQGSVLWSPGYDHAVLLTQDTDFVPLVRIVSGAPFLRPVHVLLPPSRPDAMENAQRAWRSAERCEPRVVVKQLAKADLASALLPEVIMGPGGESVRCHPTWMSRERHQQQSKHASAHYARVTPR